MQYEDKLNISTPEGVELELTLAGIGSRFMASMIDHLIQFALIAAGVALLAGVSELSVDGAQVGVEQDSDALWGIALLLIWIFLVMFAYDVLFEVRGAGRTIGKRITGLRVMRATGQPINFLSSATRNVLRVIDMLPAFYAIAIATMFASSRNQRLGDMAAGTIVVRERTGADAVSARRDKARRATAATPVSAQPVALAPATDGWDVSGISAGEVATVRRFLERRDGFAPAAREKLAADLAARLRSRVAGAPPELAPEQFLEAISAAKAARA